MSRVSFADEGGPGALVVLLGDYEGRIELELAEDGGASVVRCSFDGAGSMGTRIPGVGSNTVTTLQAVKAKHGCGDTLPADDAAVVRGELLEFFDAHKGEIEAEWHEDFSNYGVMSK